MRVHLLALTLAAGALWIGCSEGNDAKPAGTSSGAGGSSAASTTGTSTGASTSTSAGAGGGTGSASAVSSSSASSSSSSASSSSSGSGGGGGGEPCLDNKQLIGAVDKVSTGEVINLSTTPEVKEIYVDATAGSDPTKQKFNPWIYVNLAKAARVDVTDLTEFTSSEWDMALKRAVLRTNGGDSGPGMGGAVFLEGRPFESVTSSDLASATIKTEAWFSAPCEPIYDESGRLATTFTGWYDYDVTVHVLVPHPGTFLVRDAAGAIYKLAILDFYSTPDGTTAMTPSRYKLRYAKLSP